MEPGIQLLVHKGKNWIDSRRPWRSRCAPPATFAFEILQTQSGSACQKP